MKNFYSKVQYLFVAIILFVTSFGLYAQDIAVNISGVASTAPNTAISYKVYVTNNSLTNAANVTVSVPTTANFTQGTVTCSGGPGNNGSSSCPASLTGIATGILIPSLPSGSAVVFTINGTATTAGYINFTAIANFGGDTNATNNTVTYSTRVVAPTANCGQSVYRLNVAQTIAQNTIAVNGGTLNLIYTLESGLPIPSLGTSFPIPVVYSDLINRDTSINNQWRIFAVDGADLVLAINSIDGVTGSIYTSLPSQNRPNSPTYYTNPYPTNLSVDKSVTELLKTGQMLPLGTFTLGIGNLPSLPAGVSVSSEMFNIQARGAANNTNPPATPYPIQIFSGNLLKPLIQNTVNDPSTGNTAYTLESEIELGQNYAWRYTAFRGNGEGVQVSDRGVIFKNTNTITFSVDCPCVISSTNPDSDEDGVANDCDLDDDNDGILDTLESPPCYSCTLGTTNTWTSYQTYSTSSTLLPPAVDESAAFGSQNPETIIATKFPHADPFGFGMPWYNNMTLKPTNNVFGIIDELGTPPAATSAHSEWHVNMAIWQPPLAMANQTLRIRTNNNGYYPVNVGLGKTETSKLFAKVNDGTAPMRSASAGIDFNYNEVNLGNWNGTSCIILALFMFDQSLLHDNGVIEYWNGTAWTPLPTADVSAMPAITPGCTNDTDGDGIPNHLDLDSDGDGCPDAREGAGNFNPTTSASGPISTQSPNINFGTAVDPATGIPLAVGAGQGIGQSQDGTKNDCLDSDGDGLPDWEDLDDDNDGILDTDECSPDLLAVYALNNFATLVTGYTSDNTKFLQLRPSDFGLITPGATNQNRTRDYSSFYGLPPGSIIVTVENGNVHPTANPLNPLTDVFYVSARPGVGNTKVTISGTLGAYMVVEHGRHYYGNHERGIRFLDGSHLNPTANLIDLASQTTSPGNWESGSAGNYYYVRHTNATTPVEATFTYGLVNAQYSPKRVSVSTDNAVPTEYSTFFIRILPECDTDKDGIPNRLDLDSDNDGCIDAIEGGGTISSSQVTDALGTVSVGFGSTATNQNLGNTVDANGVPTIVNGGQTVGDSQNALVNGCVCYEDPALVSGTTYPVKQGITLLGRAGKVSTGTTNTPSDWPMIRNSAYTALESKTKGFVITRNSEPEGIIDPTKKIAIPIVGMMVFDTDENSGAGCLKIYTGSGTGEGWKCFTTPTCP